ncbi:Serine/threonine-protein phosphatase PP1 [Histomonas meleagridis]|uniref:Serine/threonine-protein phosphatase PP1 n=1 Tax=Histomonas meleagridis TaxID=135588 RepID=UPI003559F491|nr:Serine/threonine-protein phosphatase PP1 [Histomonas meleagridis]KAH0805562.1 Serine/threonine-protein phosphatase PP1 [Histomonas meleagridis]
MEKNDLIEIANNILLLSGQNKVPIRISGKQILDLIETTSNVLMNEPPVLKLEGRFTVVGDLHGNCLSLVYILNKYGLPPDTSYLFLGDYVDRGNHSCELLILLYSLKALFPNNIYLLRGNHEFLSVCSQYGFSSECCKKFNEHVFLSFVQSFQFLPISAIVNNQIFCVHGGISEQIKSFDDINKISKVQIENPNLDSIESDLLWSDPSIDVDEYGVSIRGVGHVFGAEALDNFLKICNFTRVIRAHEFCELGYETMFGADQKIVTVFSSYDYCGQYNSAGIVRIDENNEIDFDCFAPLDVKQSMKNRMKLINYQLIPKINPIVGDEILHLDKCFKSELIEI